MIKKHFNIAEIIIYIVVLVLSWVDGTYNSIARSMQGSFRSSTSLSFVNCSVDCLTMDNIIFPIGWIFVGLVLITLVMLFVETLQIKKVKKEILVALPIISLIAFLAISAYVDSLSGGSFWYNGDLRRSHLEMGVLFYIEVILLLICSAFSVLNNFSNSKVLRHFRVKGLTVKRDSTENDVRLETADELKNLKTYWIQELLRKRNLRQRKRLCHSRRSRKTGD